MKKKNVLLTLFSVLLIGLLFGCLLYLEDDIGRILELTAPYSHMVFFFIQFLSVIFAPIPSNITATAGAMFFGPMESFMITYLAVAIGSVSVFAFVRYFRRKLDQEKMNRKIGDSRYLKLLYEKPTLFLFIAFLLPVFPDDVICYLAGLTSIKPWLFALLIIIARPWGLAVASGVGILGQDLDTRIL